MEKRCFSVKTKEFEDCLKSYYHYQDPNEKSNKTPSKEEDEKEKDNKKRLEQLMNTIAELEKKENDFKYSVKIPINGKTLSKQSDDNIYSLNIGYRDRAMAVIIEKDKKKIYAWFWVGSHEEYSAKIKRQNYKQKSATIESLQKTTIDNKIQEIKKESAQTQPANEHIDKINKLRKSYQPEDKKKSKKDKKYR